MAVGRRSGIGDTLSDERMGAVTDFFLGGSLAPSVHRFVPLSNPPRNSNRLVNWRKSLGQQLEINENPVGAPFGLDPLESPPLARSLGPIRLPKE